MSISAKNVKWVLKRCVKWMRWIKKLNAPTAGVTRQKDSCLFLELVEEVKAYPTVRQEKPHHLAEAEGFNFPVWKLKNVPDTVEEKFQHFCC